MAKKYNNNNKPNTSAEVPATEEAKTEEAVKEEAVEEAKVEEKAEEKEPEVPATEEAKTEEVVKEEAVEEKKEEPKVEEPKTVVFENKKTISEAKPESTPVLKNASDPSAPVKTAQGRIFNAGQAVKFVNEPLYNNAGSRTPIRKITGVYYIYDDVERKGYYRICAERGHVRKGINYIIGYIKK